MAKAQNLKMNKAISALKEQNNPAIWLVIGLNFVTLYAVSVADALKFDSAFSIYTALIKLIPASISVIFSTILTGVISSDTKAQLVFLRRVHALPGHRAFSQYALHDPRIDIGALERHVSNLLPTDPVEQNKAWYKLYKTVEDHPAVSHTHKDFLLLRDYTGLSAVFIVVCGAIGFFTIRSISVWLAYVLILVFQGCIVRLAASNYGTRMVTTVLAIASTKPAKETPKPSAPAKKR